MNRKERSKPWVFAFSGAHSCGKSTTLNDVFAQLSQKGYAVARTVDVARESAFPLNTESNFLAQMSIMERHIQQERKYMHSKNRIILLDRTVYDHIAYAAWLNENQKITDQELKTLWERVEDHEVEGSYDGVFYLSLLPLIVDTTRSNSVQYQIGIQDKINDNLTLRVDEGRIIYVQDTDRNKRCQIISREIVSRMEGE